EAVGHDVSRLNVGDRVAMLSQNAYAEYDVAHEDQVVILPDCLADQPFPAEPLGCAMNIFARCGIKPGQSVAIIGIGFLGALLTQLTENIGARVIAISRRQYSLDVGAASGASHTIP